jgi:hypothetical protein
MKIRVSILVAIGFALVFGPGCGQAPVPSPIPKTLSAEARQAVRFAQAFLTKNGIDWGEPSQVRTAEVEYLPGWKGDGFLQVTWPTPTDELKLLGDRSVVVEIRTGQVKFVPRD